MVAGSLGFAIFAFYLCVSSVCYDDNLEMSLFANGESPVDS